MKEEKICSMRIEGEGGVLRKMQWNKEGEGEVRKEDEE